MASTNNVNGLPSIPSSLDSDYSTAWSDLNSSSMQKQLQGQELMNLVMQRYNAISAALKDQHDMEQNAINNSKSNG